MSADAAAQPSRRARPHPARGFAASVTTLTAVPLPPSAADVPRGAVLGFAPAVGLVLAAVAVGVGEAGRWLFPGDALLVAVIAVAALAVLTRGLHLDGLADTVDGLGPFRDRDRALAVMRRSDIGPFGVVALGLVLLADVAAASRCVTTDRLWCLGVAVVAGRLAMAWCGRAGVPAARPDGLGAAVAGSVPTPVAVGWTALVLVAAALPWALGHGGLAIRGLAAAVVALMTGAVVCAAAVRRFGGITGDVLGAVVELSTASALIAAVVR